MTDQELRLDYIEKMGTGIARMRNWMAGAGLKPPKFTFTTFFTVTFPRPAQVTQVQTVGANQRIRDAVNDAISDTINDTISEGLRTRLAEVLARLLQHGSVLRSDVQRQFAVSEPTAKRYLLVLKRGGLVKLEGSRKAGTYVLTDKGKALLKESGK